MRTLGGGLFYFISAVSISTSILPRTTPSTRDSGQVGDQETLGSATVRRTVFMATKSPMMVGLKISLLLLGTILLTELGMGLYIKLAGGEEVEH